MDEKTKEIVERPWFCDITGNPFGTDTLALGVTCQCQGCRAARKITSLSERVGELEREAQTARPVVAAACGVVEADTYKHPMLSRADAVQAGVMALHDAVNKWWASRPPCQQGEGS